jgi:lactose/L-arabinose transport system permease protein
MDGMTAHAMPAWRRALIGAVAVAGAALFFLPFWWNLVWATWNTSEIFAVPPKFLPGPHLLDNLRELQDRIRLGRVFLNSLGIAAVSVAGALFFCSLAGYAFAKYQFRFKNALFYLLLATLAVPSQITSIPLYILMLRLGWIDTYQAIILPGLVPAFGVFLLRQSVEAAIPTEMLEAARLDGATEFGIYFRIVLPNLLPHLATLGIFVFTGAWGSLFWPLIVLRSPEMFTLPIALSSLIGTYEQPYDLLMIGSLIAVVPPLLLFLLLQRYFVKSLVGSALKG